MIYKNVSLRWRNFLEAFGPLVCIGGTVFVGAIKLAHPSPSHFGTEQHCSGLWSHHLCGKKKAFPFSNVIYSAFFLLWPISADALVTRVDTRHKGSFVSSCIFTQLLFIFYPWRSPDSHWELDHVPGWHPSPSQHTLVQRAELESPSMLICGLCGVAGVHGEKPRGAVKPIGAHTEELRPGRDEGRPRLMSSTPCVRYMWYNVFIAEMFQLFGVKGAKTKAGHKKWLCWPLYLLALPLEPVTINFARLTPSTVNMCCQTQRSPSCLCIFSMLLLCSAQACAPLHSLSPFVLCFSFLQTRADLDC